MSFRFIQGKLVALYPSIQIPKIAVNGLIQPSQIVRMVAQTGIISIIGHVLILYCLWEIIDVDVEKKVAKT